MLVKHYGSLDLIYELDGEEFVNFTFKAFEIDKKRNEEKIDELLLHRWGYELPFMEEPLDFNQYRNLALGEEPRKVNTQSSNETNEQLIERINKIKEIDQKVNRSEVVQ